jgi:thiamine pyrophosphate-dependent acetolactate synthase large subunit-like protein/nitrite reductase/ring-hydroxylating ferredoxin subunit
MAVTGSVLTWHRVLDAVELPDGRVRTVVAGHRSIALTHVDGRWGALDNRCPHQGGPLGEGTIENGLLRCPWHGFDYCPLTGGAPSAFGDTVPSYAVEVRDGSVFVGVPEEVPHARTVSDAMAETMVAWGVRHVFGMVGHSNLGLADALRRREAAGELTFIGIRHEGAAAFAASAYGKLTGRPAGCLTIAGPGATNLLTGLWDARLDHAPVLALTGQVDAQVLGPGAFQEVDLSSAFAPVAGWSQTVLPESRHSELMALACRSALLHHDVSHLIFPDDVQTLPAPDDAIHAPEGRVADERIRPAEGALDHALGRLHAAKRPVVVAGVGAREDMASVIELAERLLAPVITTFRAKGQMPEDHPLAGGVLGRSGTPVASWLMNEADLLIVLGASFANHTGIYPGHPTIHVDSDRAALGRVHGVAVPVWGDVGETVRALHGGLDPAHLTDDQRGDVVIRWGLWREEKASRARDDRGRGVASAAVFAALQRHVPADAVLTVDVGNHAYSFGRYFECTGSQTVLMSGLLGSIGFGYPAAIGAWAAQPHRPTIAITGDGGYAQYMAELTTAVKHGMTITHVLLDNGQLGKIAKEQRAGEWDVWQTELHNPDFAEWARICGALGLRVDDATQLDDALTQALAHDGPSLVHVRTDAELV